MEPHAQRGSALVETAVATALAAVVAGAVLSASILATHAERRRVVRAALESQLKREMTIALDIVKYRGGDIRPTTVATTLPLPAGTPLPITVSIAVSPGPHDSIAVTLTAAPIAAPRQQAQLSASIGERAPQPGDTIVAPGLVPAPTGAP